MYVYNLICVYYHIYVDKGTFLYTCEVYGHYTNSMYIKYVHLMMEIQRQEHNGWLVIQSP